MPARASFMMRSRVSMPLIRSVEILMAGYFCVKSFSSAASFSGSHEVATRTLFSLLASWTISSRFFPSRWLKATDENPTRATRVAPNNTEWRNVLTVNLLYFDFGIRIYSAGGFSSRRPDVFENIQTVEPVDQINQSVPVDENVIGLRRLLPFSRRRNVIADFFRFQWIGDVDDA